MLVSLQRIGSTRLAQATLFMLLCASVIFSKAAWPVYARFVTCGNVKILFTFLYVKLRQSVGVCCECCIVRRARFFRYVCVNVNGLRMHSLGSVYVGIRLRQTILCNFHKDDCACMR